MHGTRQSAMKQTRQLLLRGAKYGDAVVQPLPTCCRRQDNLQGRADTKKAHKVEKREKKLMRAGFEGRRATFINP